MMGTSGLAGWMKEHQIWGVVVGAVLATVATVVHDYWTRESTRISCLVAEGSLLNDELAKRVGKHVDVRIDGTSLKDARTATVWLTNTGTASVSRPEFCMFKKGGQIVMWSLAEGSRVLQDGAIGDIQGDRLRLQLPFLNPGERAVIQVLTQGTNEPGISVESATAGLVLEGRDGQPDWNATMAGVIVGVFFLGGWVASSGVREVRDTMKQIRRSREEMAASFREAELAQERLKEMLDRKNGSSNN